MILAIILCWVGYKLQAPWWLYVLMVANAFWDYYKYWHLEDAIEDIYGRLNSLKKGAEDETRQNT